MKWKRTPKGEPEHLTEERKALAVRYTVDAAEAERRGLAADAATRVRPTSEPVSESQPPVAAPEPQVAQRRPQRARASRPTPAKAGEAPAVAERPASYPHVFSVPGRHLVLIGITFAAAAAYSTNWHSPVRVAVTVVFLLFLPGLALAEIAPLADSVERLVVGIGASVALETLVAVAFLYGGFFTPGRVFAVFVVATAGLTAVAAFRARQASS
jgi:hypothetical protein